MLLEANPYWGGRASSEEYEGFTLDRGFQVFFYSLPRCSLVLELQNLKAGPVCFGGVPLAGRASAV
jgi:phytoene dehydrogenase-like protein